LKIIMLKRNLLTLVVAVLCLIFGAAEIKAQRNNKIPKDLKITLERTVCFGTCPKYTLIVKANGSVNFDGMKFTNKIGKAKGKINSGKIRQLIAEIKNAGFFELKDKYETGNDGCLIATDHSSAILTIQMSGRKKTINHYLGCYDPDSDNRAVFPQALYNLENKIDEIVGTERWIGERK
jgi:uncharacterized protein DUF6438